MMAFSLFQVTTDTYPGAIQAFTTANYKYAWGAFMLIGFGCAVVGMVMRNHSRALVYEAWGMYMSGAATLIYCGALLGLNKSTAYLAATSFAVIGLGCIGQGLYIHWQLKRIAVGKFRVNSTAIYTMPELPKLEDE